MRHLLKNLIVVVLSYSLALSSPVAAKTNSLRTFDQVKSYVNGSSKKSFKGLIQKLELILPDKVYEDALKRMKAPEGSRWFDAAKIANNYSYFRILNSKIFIRTTEEKGQVVFYANGMKIKESDFRSMKLVENKLMMAFVAGYSAPQKNAFLTILNILEADAGPIDVAPALPEQQVVADIEECERIAMSYNQMLTQDPNAAQSMLVAENADGDTCFIPPAVATNTVPAAAVVTSGFGRYLPYALMGLAALLVLFAIARNNKNKNNSTPPPPPPPPTTPPTTPPPTETPEDTSGVGRDDYNPYPTGGVNCGGDGANCGETTPVPVEYVPGEPSSEPTGDEESGSEGRTPASTEEETAYDPNQYAIPMSKTKKK